MRTEILDSIPKGSIIFHVGLPKSGTTSLQIFLKDFGPKFGLTYLRCPGQTDLQSRFFFRAFTMGGRRMPDEERARCLEWAQEAVEGAGGNFVVISDEVLTQIDHIERKEFSAYCKKISGDRPMIALLYVRPLFSWIESLINQLIKNGNFYFRSFDSSGLDQIGNFCANYEKIANFYSSEGFQVVVRPYPRDIVLDFVNFLDLDTSKIPKEGERANRSPDNLEAIREFFRIRENRIDPSFFIETPPGRTLLSKRHVEQIWETLGETLVQFELSRNLPEGSVNDYHAFLESVSELGMIEGVSRALDLAE